LLNSVKTKSEINSEYTPKQAQKPPAEAIKSGWELQEAI
jgi:hypothetical protein